jgi:iron complex outermembrane receptor protein
MRKNFMVGCAAISIAVLGSGTAFAQAGEGASTDGEIIVTANKREQSVNDVGLTITAATGEALTNRGISGPADLAKLVPGFTFTQSIYSTPVYTLRGIGLYDATFGASPSVSVYSDQIPRNVPVMSDALDLDIERVEVLKGPQGTLFGQSSTGGAINYIVAKPTREFSAGIYGSYERFDRFELSGFVSGPLGEKAAARLAVKGITGGAWQRSLSRPNDENGDARKLMGRLTVDLEPSDGIKIELMATGVKDRSDPQAPQYAGSKYNVYSAAALAAANANPATRNPFGIVDNKQYADFTTASSPGFDSTFLGTQTTLVSRLNGANAADAAGARATLGTQISDKARDGEWTPGFLTKSDNSYYQLSGRVDFDLTDSITVTSISALAEQKLAYNQDLDATVARSGGVPLDGSVKTFNQEVRLAGTTDTLNWLVGASYDNVRAIQNNKFELYDYSGNFGGLIVLTENNFSSKMRSYGLFANAELEVTPSLTVQAGVRYTNNKQQATYCYNDPVEDVGQGTAFVFGQFLNSVPINIKPGECFVTAGSLLTGNAKSTLVPVVSNLQEDNVSFRFGVNYKFDQGALIYATVSQGYKSGIFSAIGASSASQYTPAGQEKVVAFEAGFKAPLADGKVQLNAAAFYYDYSNKQVRGRISDAVFGLLEKMLNVPKSRIFGLEGELVLRPAEGLNLSASATYLDAKVTQNYSQTPDGLKVFNAAGYSGNFKDSFLPYTPKFSANADIQYEFAVGNDLKAFVGGTVTYQGSQNATFTTAILPAVDFVIPGYATVDARLGVASSDDRWRASLFGRNLTNKSYITGVSTYLDTRNRYRGRPLVYGLSLAYKY